MSAKGFVEPIDELLKSFWFNEVKETRKQNKRISTRLTARQREAIEEKIAKREHENLSAFLRSAIEKAIEA